LFFAFVTASVAVAQDAGEAPAIGVSERLGEYVPLDLVFLDANGDSVRIGDCLDKPAVLSLVYFHCPTICKPLLTNIADVVERTDMDPGKEYNLVTVSFDEHDTPTSATEIKRYITTSKEKLNREGAWRFLTGDAETIKSLTDAVGFGMERQEKDFAHGAALIVIAPDGKIVRYLYGLRYQPFDLKMAVAEADKGNITPTVARVLRYCFSYDPEGRRYVLNVTRLAGTGGLLLAVGWVFYITTVGRKRKEKVRT